jgi:hypothetical protein
MSQSEYETHEDKVKEQADAELEEIEELETDSGPLGLSTADLDTQM